MLLTVFIAFWCVEFPASFMDHRDWKWRIPEWFGFFYAHTFPEIFVSVEFLMSSVRFEWRRFWIYFVSGLMVLVMNIIVTFEDD